MSAYFTLPYLINLNLRPRLAKDRISSLLLHLFFFFFFFFITHFIFIKFYLFYGF